MRPLLVAAVLCAAPVSLAAPAEVVTPAFVGVARGATITARGDLRAVSVDAAGRVTVQAAGAAKPATFSLLPVEKDVKRRVARFGAVLVPGGGGDLLVFADSEVQQTQSGETGWLLDDMLAARVDGTGAPRWRQRISNGSGDPTRELFVTERRAVLRERDAIEGVDVENGKKVWRVDRDATESLLNDAQFWHAKLDPALRTLWVSGRFALATSDGRRAFELELDVDSGGRVNKKVPYVKPPVRPIYVRPEFRLEYPSDRAPPEVPRDWDGLAIRRSYLAWSKTTGEGIIVEPLASDAKAIIEAASAVRVKGAPVRWLYVVDLIGVRRGQGDKLPEESAALAAAKLGAPSEIALVSTGSVERAGERVDAATVATALKAKVVDGSTALSSVPLALFRPTENDRRVVGSQERFACLQWGPYFFADEDEVAYFAQELPW